MEYIFGTDGDNETLKTVGRTHTDFNGFLSTSRENGGTTTIDRCRILDHFKSEEDAEGNCYDWYTITDHYRYEDRQVDSVEKDDVIAELMEMIAVQDDAIAEILEMIGGKEE